MDCSSRPDVMTIFDITIAGRRFSVARERYGHSEFYQLYSVDGCKVPVQRYLELIGMARAGISFHSIPVRSLPASKR
jgi:hypothetical protein